MIVDTEFGEQLGINMTTDSGCCPECDCLTCSCEYDCECDVEHRDMEDVKKTLDQAMFIGIALYMDSAWLTA